MEEDSEPESGLSCTYCSCNLQRDDFKSCFDKNHHYVIHKCGSCGKDNWIKLDLEGAHPGDMFKKNSVESNIKKVFENEY